jgi:hypothetical protein
VVRRVPRKVRMRSYRAMPIAMSAHTRPRWLVARRVRQTSVPTRVVAAAR